MKRSDSSSSSSSFYSSRKTHKYQSRPLTKTLCLNGSRNTNKRRNSVTVNGHVPNGVTETRQMLQGVT